MEKLISKNPVLRFKEGNKVEKNYLYTFGKTKDRNGYAVGVQKNWRESNRFNRYLQELGDIYDYLVDANEGNHFGNTKELQKFINSKLSELSNRDNRYYGSIAEDNKFGDQTEEGARLVYELLKNGSTQNAYMPPIPQTISNIYSNTYSNPNMKFNRAATRGFLNSINAKNTNDLVSGIMNMNKDDLTKQLIYNRAGITSDMNEQAIRDRLGNTFALLGIHGHLGGNDRRRFRNWFNPQEVKNSSNLNSNPTSTFNKFDFSNISFNPAKNLNLKLYKKGGLLPKSSVEKFKLTKGTSK